MRFTQKQTEWANHERETLKQIIASKPREGLFRYIAMEEALQMIINLHNIEMNEIAEAKIAESAIPSAEDLSKSLRGRKWSKKEGEELVALIKQGIQP